MKVQVVCPGCGKRSNVDSDRVGNKLRCKACETVFQVSGKPPARPQVDDEPEWDDDSAWLDDGAEGEVAVPSRPAIPRSRRASDGGGSSAGATIAIGAGAAGVLIVVIGLAVFMSGGQGRVPAPGGGPAPADPAPGTGLVDRVLGAVAGTPPKDEAAGYPDVGPLLPPLLPPPPLRDLNSHERRARATIAFIDRMADILGGIRDAPSFKTAGEQLLDLKHRSDAEMARDPEPFRMTPAEDSDLTRRLAPEMRRSMARLRQETERIAGLSGVGLAGVSLNSAIQMATLPGEEALKRAEAFKPQAGPAPYAEVFVRLHGPNDAIVLKEKLERLLDADKGIQWSHRSQGEEPRASFRVWPVPDVEALADRIHFGKATVKGRRIFVEADPVPADELATAKEAQEKAEAARKAQMEKAFHRPEDDDPKPPPDADDLTRTMFALRSSSAGKRKEGVDRLLLLPPDDARREEVHKQLAGMLSDSDTFLVTGVMKAIVRWRTDDTVPALIKLLDHPMHNIRWDAAELLGAMGDARAAEPLVAHLKQDGIKVEPALRALGPAAESAIIGLLRHPEWQVRVQACRLLEDVGGKEALETMMSLPADREFLVQSAAREAMQAMRARVGPIPTPGKDSSAKGRSGKTG